MTGLDDLRWAWWAHRQVPYQFREVWTKQGRTEHYRRLTEHLAAPMALRVREELSKRGFEAPGTWTDIDLAKLHEVLVDRCYDVEGFEPAYDGLSVDAGCGYGDFSLLAAARGRVAAFDPNPQNVQRTRELLETNHLADRLSAQAVALGRSDGAVLLGRAGEAMLARGSNRSSQEHPMRALDSVLSTGPVRLLKVDVEGMEADVLAGARSILLRDRPPIIVEVHGRRSETAVRELLGKFGYSLSYIGTQRFERPFGAVSNEFWSPLAQKP
jgi:FkbM family methyltransferase